MIRLYSKMIGADLLFQRHTWVQSECLKELNYKAPPYGVFQSMARTSTLSVGNSAHHQDCPHSEW